MSSTPLPFALPGGAISRGRHSVWIAILVLSPLAYLGATLLESKLPHPPQPVPMERDQAIAIARDFARRMRMETADWTANASDHSQGTIARLTRQSRPPGLDRITAPATIEVKLNGPNSRWIVVTLTPAGRVVGFVSNRPPREGARLDEGAARDLAGQYLRAQLGADSPFDLQGPAVRNTDQQGWERDFAWESPLEGLPQGKAKFHVAVAGDRVFSDSRTVELDPEFQKRLEHKRPWSAVLKWISGIYFVALGIYAIVRYARRSMEKEISHRRTILIVVTFVLAFEFTIAPYLNTSLQISSPSGQVKTLGLVLMHVVMALGVALFGLVFGIPYGAGEGDLREAYPGKLTSTDALLSGKLLSANFARSMLAGGAFAGWLLLLQNLALFLIAAAPLGEGPEVLTGVTQEHPLARLAMEQFPDLMTVVVYGVMLPLTFLSAKIRRKRLVYALLAPLVLIAAYTAGPKGNAWQNELLLDVLFATAALAPFFVGDLLAAISSVTALNFVGALLRHSAVSAEWHTLAYRQVLPAATVFLLIELYCAWRGRVYDEAEVTPLYARHMAERQELTAEIGAARLAQLRLLPDAPPPIAGLSIAGSCTPAREVGGDFFDYYALDAHRLGVFIAEGGNRELGSAMTIALAKGFLLYTSELDVNPVEILRRLRVALASVLRGENAGMSVLYAIIDGHSGSVRYARTGGSPRLLVNGRALAEEIVADRADGTEIRHGAITLAPDDALFFFTDGLSRQLADRVRQRPEEFLSDLHRTLTDAPARQLHDEVLKRVLKRRGDPPPDDVTAVVVRLEQAEARAVEGIA